jgi:hypothetical protein
MPSRPPPEKGWHGVGLRAFVGFRRPQGVFVIFVVIISDAVQRFQICDL